MLARGEKKKKRETHYSQSKTNDTAFPISFPISLSKEGYWSSQSPLQVSEAAFSHIPL